MKLVELVKISMEALKLMSKHDVKLEDYRFVGMYEEFHNMRKLGVKYRAAIKTLAEDYKVSKATIERVIRRLGLEC